MKKTLYIILFCVLLCFSSCNSQNNESSIISENDDISGSGVEANTMVKYRTFEEVLSDCTDVIIATYKNSISYSDHYDHAFTIKERMTGIDNGEEITVFEKKYYGEVDYNDVSLKYDTVDVKYEEGKQYLLLLRKRISIFQENDIYLFASDSLFIPINDFNKSKQYNEPLNKHIENKELASEFTSNDLTFVEMKSFIYESTKSNATFTGMDYIRSEKPEDIINESTYIFKVKVGEQVTDVTAADREAFLCNITNVIKGDSSLKDKTIDVLFLSGSVKTDNEYIVAVESYSENKLYFIISSRNSVFETSKETEIISYIN